MADDLDPVTFRIHIFDPDDDEWYDFDVSADAGDPTADWINATDRVDDPETTSVFALERLFIPPGPPPLNNWNPASRTDITVARYFLAANGVVVNADRIIAGRRDTYDGNINTGPGRSGRLERLTVRGTLDEIPLDEWSLGERPSDGAGEA